jgi:hypothetical protein
MQPWVVQYPTSTLSKKGALKVTVFGPYGPYLARLQKIVQALREKHGYTNTHLVRDRNDFRQKYENETNNVYNTHKSYFCLKNSNVNIFVCYTNANLSSASIELKHVIDKLSLKLPCCSVIKDKRYDLGALLEGELERNVLVELFDSRKDNCDDEIIEIANSRCLDFLYAKYKTIR